MPASLEPAAERKSFWKFQMRLYPEQSEDKAVAPVRFPEDSKTFTCQHHLKLVPELLMWHSAPRGRQFRQLLCTERGRRFVFCDRWRSKGAGKSAAVYVPISADKEGNDDGTIRLHSTSSCLCVIYEEISIQSAGITNRPCFFICLSSSKCTV